MVATVMIALLALVLLLSLPLAHGFLLAPLDVVVVAPVDKIVISCRVGLVTILLLGKVAHLLIIVEDDVILFAIRQVCN